MGNTGQVTDSPMLRVLGEIAVIVLGVLIALAADSWWEGRGDRLREEAYIRAMRIEIAETVQLLDAAVREDSTYQANSASFVRILRSGAETPVPADSIAAWARINYAYYRTRRGALRALMQTGDINLVRSEELRSEIVAFDSELDLADRELAQIDATLWTNIKDLSQFAEQLWEAEESRSLRGRTDLQARGFTSLVREFDVNVLRESPSIRAAYGTHELTLRNRARVMGRLETAAVRLLCHLEMDRPCSEAP